MNFQFQPGQLLATPGAIEKAQNDMELLAMLVSRHVNGDFGDMDDEDIETNKRAIKHGGRIMSSYKLFGDGTLWVITEADRMTTTILCPNEY